MFKGFFKPLSKRDARIAAVLFGAGFLYMLYTIIKDMLAGRTFDELHSDFMILAFVGIIEWGMLTISFGKEKNAVEDKDEESAEVPAVTIEGTDDLPAEENTYGDGEESDGNGSEDAFGGDSAGDAADGGSADGGEGAE